MKKILITLSLLIISFTSYSQEQLQPLKYYKVVFHIIRTSAGTIETEGVETYIQKILKFTNDKFKGANIQFYMCGINYINDDLYYNHDNNRDYNLTKTYNDTTAINVYLCNSIVQGYGFASMPSISSKKNTDIIIVRHYAEIVTITHEFGHFFGLYHTHENYIPELVNGSNCSVAGDYHCDTPADPDLKYETYVDENCNYTGTMVDALGDPYRPDTSLIMSYARHKCRTRFSNDQFGAIRYWADRIERDCYSHTHTFEDVSITTNQDINEDVILIKDTKIENNAEVKLKSCAFVEISGDSEVKLGSTLDIRIE